MTQVYTAVAPTSQAEHRGYYAKHARMGPVDARRLLTLPTVVVDVGFGTLPTGVVVDAARTEDSTGVVDAARTEDSTGVVDAARTEDSTGVVDAARTEDSTLPTGVVDAARTEDSTEDAVTGEVLSDHVVAGDSSDVAEDTTRIVFVDGRRDSADLRAVGEDRIVLVDGGPPSVTSQQARVESKAESLILYSCVDIFGQAVSELIIATRAPTIAEAEAENLITTAQTRGVPFDRANLKVGFESGRCDVDVGGGSQTAIGAAAGGEQHAGQLRGEFFA